ncbi:Sphingosine-1-phosphate lyase [Eufriesea mexicana]|uniref:sphinganine-1-phosphate aldolase n=1 Tax=Eufriesea mexicana TaxID=516756 RepID=A0A310SG84_9HYME|nr:Sphingosine-1-phosphate lyase [Eufriesea mexicana]
MCSLVVSGVKQMVNNYFEGKEPWQIVTMTSSTVLTSIWLWNFIFQDESLVERAKKSFFNLMTYIPAVREKIDQELNNISRSFEQETLQRLKSVPFVVKLPEKGLKPEEILKRVKECVQLGDYDWESGKVSGAIYRVDTNLLQLMGDIYTIASYTNPLHPDVFPGICKMEAEVVRIACNLFHGDEESCGTMTSGGTESILLACKTYRDYAVHMKGIKSPEIILPVTAHSAFDKAAQYLKLKVRSVPVNEHSYTVCIKSMEKFITKNTIMLVGSSPNFPYGTMDNIEAISDLGVKYNIPVHVDACLGGFLICFMQDAGFNVPPFDFRLPGVTSISTDTHKYAYAPKGSSLILYRNKKLRHCQYTITTDWPGGIYGSPTVSGSRAGGIIASCWATLILRNLDGIFIFGTPATSVIALGSNDFHIYKLLEALNAKGWHLNTLQFPYGIHLCITYVHTQFGVADQFLSDVETELNVILNKPMAPVEGKLAIYGMSQSIPDRSIVGDIAKYFLDSMYYTPQIEQISNGPNI